MENNKTLQDIFSRRSNRTITDKQVEHEKQVLLEKAFQMAPSSINGQATSLIKVTDKHIINELATLSQNPWVANTSLVYLVVADFYRTKQVEKIEEGKVLHTGVLSNLMVGTIDASLAAQNLVLAATSMGLSTTIVGGIRASGEAVRKTIKMFNLPTKTMPLFLIPVGYPATLDKDLPVPFRLPHNVVVFNNKYDQLAFNKDSIADFNNKYAQIGRKVKWTEGQANFYAKAYVPEMHDIAKEQKLITRQPDGKDW